MIGTAVWSLIEWRKLQNGLTVYSTTLVNCLVCKPPGSKLYHSASLFTNHVSPKKGRARNQWQNCFFFGRISLVLAHKWRGSWGRSGASWKHFKVPYSFKKKITYYISYISCNWLFINFFVRPTLIGVTLLIVPRFTKGAPRRSGRTKKFINNQLQLIYDI